jgi:hypothetical protein
MQSIFKRLPAVTYAICDRSTLKILPIRLRFPVLIFNQILQDTVLKSFMLLGKCSFCITL